MAKTKEQKQEIIKDLEENINRQKAMVFVNFSRVDSKSLFNLRERLLKEDCLLKITKKTLLQKALEKSDRKDLAEKINEIENQLALVFGFKDLLSPGKVCYRFSRENENLKILGGLIEGEFLRPEKVIELAQLPPREEILARMAGALKSPLSNFVYVLEGNIKGLLHVLAKAKT